MAVETFRDGINCTQAILSAWGSRHGLDRDTAMKLGGAFGSGMNMGETCGAVTGALMVIVSWLSRAPEPSVVEACVWRPGMVSAEAGRQKW